MATEERHGAKGGSGSRRRGASSVPEATSSSWRNSAVRARLPRRPREHRSGEEAQLRRRDLWAIGAAGTASCQISLSASARRRPCRRRISMRRSLRQHAARRRRRLNVLRSAAGADRGDRGHRQPTTLLAADAPARSPFAFMQQLDTTKARHLRRVHGGRPRDGIRPKRLPRRRRAIPPRNSAASLSLTPSAPQSGSRRRRSCTWTASTRTTTRAGSSCSARTTTRSSSSTSSSRRAA